MDEEKMVMMQSEIDNLQQKVAFLEALLKKAEEDRRVPSKQSWSVGNDVSN